MSVQVRFVYFVPSNNFLIFLQVSSEGCSYGKLEIVNTELQLISAVSSKNIFVMKLDNVSQCVVPANNRDDIEIQFADSQARERVEDCLVQFTLHFPKDETEDGLTIAEDYHKQIMDTGAIKSVTGDIIVEFSKEQGNFVAPRGKYALQVFTIRSTSMPRSSSHFSLLPITCTCKEPNMLIKFLTQIWILSSY